MIMLDVSGPLLFAGLFVANLLVALLALGIVHGLEAFHRRRNRRP